MSDAQPPPTNPPVHTAQGTVAEPKKAMHPLMALGVALLVLLGVAGLGVLGLLGLVAYTCSR